ncbi:RIO1 family regulatory kinase/ATPase domain-containing protein [Methanocella arvoryzae]|nr:RIO1 family regulatory kinase/ATPase [Methanocella arvoryzae]
MIMTRMSAEQCEPKKVFIPAPDRLLRRIIYVVLMNRAVEAVLVSLIAIGFLLTSIIDGIIGTRVERQFIASLRSVSKDRLSPLRRAQIRYIFRCHYGLSRIGIKLAGGSYWLSIPCVVKGRREGRPVKYLAKIINDQSAVKHRYMTMLRNLGIIAGGAEMWFETYEDARDMASFERHCLSRLREEGVNAPAVLGMHQLNEDDYMLVTEFIEGRTLSDVAMGVEEISEVLAILKKMHDSKVIHGDIKLDNFLYSDGKIYLVDCLKIGHTALPVAQAFDLICALCSLCEKAPVDTVISLARSHFTENELLYAGTLLDIAVAKADIDLSPEKSRELRRELGNPV